MKIKLFLSPENQSSSSHHVTKTVLGLRDILIKVKYNIFPNVHRKELPGLECFLILFHSCNYTTQLSASS